MLSPAEYREHARQLVEQAQTAKPDRRLTLLHMAETFIRLADESAMLEKMQTEQRATG